jgi:hypothetical protein
VDAAEVRSSFIERGVVRLDGAFSADAAASIRDVVWSYANRRTGVDLGDRSTWPEGPLQLSWKRVRRHPVFDIVADNRAVTDALDVVFGAGGWRHPGPGAQVLFNLPVQGPWTLPDGWHMDCGFEQPTWPVFAVKLFAFVGAVGPCGGGTMLLPGTHQLVDRYRHGFEHPPAGSKATWHPFLRHYEPLGGLLAGAGQPDRGRSLVGQRFDIEGVPIDVVELTGSPGDVVITHLHVFHTTSPDTTDVPRQMISKALFAA